MIPRYGPARGDKPAISVDAKPLTDRRCIVPLALVTSLFFLWALGVNLNDILIPHLKKAFHLTDFPSFLIQSAFFGGYFLAALRAGWLMERFGYRKGILVGLITCATGALLFTPAASVRSYGFFLFALFVMACGQGVLEVAANPYASRCGADLFTFSSQQSPPVMQSLWRDGLSEEPKPRHPKVILPTS